MPARCSQSFCTLPATRQSYADTQNDADPWDASNYVPWCAGHAPRGAWPIVPSEPTRCDACGTTGPAHEADGLDCRLVQDDRRLSRQDDER